MTNYRCTFDGDGWLQGPIDIEHHLTPNRYPGSLPHSAVQGVIMHTMVGNLPGTDSVFMNPSFGASAHFGISQTGQVIQWVPLGSGAWHIVSGNGHWYGIEHADNADPHNPITEAQAFASAQIVQALSQAAIFPLQVCNSTGGEGYGCHYLGGAAWGGHSCPDYPSPGVPFARSTQRAGILASAKSIGAGEPVVPPKPSPAPVESNPTLSEGATGSAVETLQKDLNDVGAAKPDLVVDGDFGAKTLAAVREFQKTHKLSIDGVVGPLTWGALKSAVSQKKLGPRK